MVIFRGSGRVKLGDIFKEGIVPVFQDEIFMEIEKQYGYTYYLTVHLKWLKQIKFIFITTI